MMMMWTVFGWSFNTLSVYETRELISDPTSVCVCVLIGLSLMNVREVKSFVKRRKLFFLRV